jgi:hypothetical protein
MQYHEQLKQIMAKGKIHPDDVATLCCRARPTVECWLTSKSYHQNMPQECFERFLCKMPQYIEKKIMQNELHNRALRNLHKEISSMIKTAT